jgi:hypothetical protein
MNSRINLKMEANEFRTILFEIQKAATVTSSGSILHHNLRWSGG